MDNDNSGYVSRAELKEGLMDIGVPGDSDDMDTLLMHIDDDGDGRVGVFYTHILLTLPQFTVVLGLTLVHV